MKYMKIDKGAITPKVREVLRRDRRVYFADGRHVFVQLWSPEGRIIKNIIPPKTWSVYSM